MTWKPSPPPEDREPRPIAASLAAVARRLGGSEPGVITAVFAHWEELVGPAMAAHTRPLSLRGGVLVVGVDQPAWATEVRYLGADLARRVSTVTGRQAVTEVRVRVEGEQGRGRSSRGRGGAC